MNKLRIIFMGTPDFAVEALTSILKTEHDVIAVYAQPPRPKGRGQALQKSPVHIIAEQHHIPVFTPQSLRKDPEAVRAFIALNADIAIVAAYGLILPKDILDAPRFGCLNIHASLLPRWRGASPIQHAIWQGDTESGITIMKMSEGLDEGDIIEMESTSIINTTTAAELHDILAKMGGDMIVDVLGQYASDDIPTAIAQESAQSNYAPLLLKEDGIIDWSQEATLIDQQVRALNPWPSTTAIYQDKRFKVLAGIAIDTDYQNQEIGTILNAQGDIICGNGGVYRILTIQPDNGKKMSVGDAINGGHFKIGDQFQ
jgi:methionyl-tRNA formyltransferase